MVKHTKTICQLLPMNCLSVFDHFVGLALKGLRFNELCRASSGDTKGSTPNFASDIKQTKVKSVDFYFPDITRKP